MDRLTPGPGGQSGPGPGPQRLLTSSFSWDPAASFTSTLDIDAIAVSHTTDCSLSSEPRSMSWEEPGPGPPLLVAHDMESPPMLEPAMDQETSSESESESEESEDSGSSSSSCSSVESDASSEEESEIINANRRTRKSSGGARKSLKSQQHSSKEPAVSSAPSQSCPSPPVLQKHGSFAPRRHLSGQSSRSRQRSGSTKASLTSLLSHKSDMTVTLESCPVPEKEEKISITNNLQGILLHKKDATAFSKSNRIPETYSRSHFGNDKIVTRKKPSPPEQDTSQDTRIRPNTKDISCDDSDEDSDCMILETSPKLKSWTRPQEKLSSSHSDGAEYKHKQSLISGIYRPKHLERGSGHKQSEPHLLALSPPSLSEPSNSEAESNEDDSVSDSGSASSVSSSEAEAEEATVTASHLDRLSSDSGEGKHDNSGTNSSSDESLPPPLLEPQVMENRLSFKVETNKGKAKEDKKKKYFRKQGRVECGSQTELCPSSPVSRTRPLSSPDDLVTQSAAPPVLFGFGFKEPRHKRGRPRKNPPTLQPELPVPGEPEPVTSDASASAEESCQEKEEAKFVTGKPTVYFPSSSSKPFFKKSKDVERKRHDDGVYEFTDDSNAAPEYRLGPSSASESEDFRSKICDRKHSKAPSYKGRKKDKNDATLSTLEPVKDRGRSFHGKSKSESGAQKASSFSGLVSKEKERKRGHQTGHKDRSDHDEIDSVENSESSRPNSRVTDSESSSIRDYSERFKKKVVLKGEKKPATQQVFRQFSTKVNQNFGKTTDLIFPKRFCTLKPDAFWKIKKRRSSGDDFTIKPENQVDVKDNSATNSVATKASLKEMPSCPRNQLQQMMSVLASATRVNSKAVKGPKKEKDCKKTDPDFRDRSAYDSANDTLSEDEESNNGRRKNKKGWKSKHKNVIDPVFLGELEHLIRDISSVQLEIKPSRDFWPDRPSDCVPSIFKRRKIFSNKKKRDIHKARRGRSSKNSDSGKIEIDLTNDADADEQRLPLKKRHHHLQGREGSKEASSKDHDSAARQQGLIKVKTPEKIIREFKNSSLNTGSTTVQTVKGFSGGEMKTVQDKLNRKPTAADRIVEKLGIQIKKDHCIGRSIVSRKTSVDLEPSSKDDQAKNSLGRNGSRELSRLPSVQIKSESKLKDSRLNKQESATFVENIQGCIDKYTASSEIASGRPLSFNNQQEFYKSEPNLTNAAIRRDTLTAKSSVPGLSSPEPDVSGRDSSLSQYSNSSDCVVVESQDRDDSSNTGRRARLGRSSRQDLHSHLWRQSDTQSPEPSASSSLLAPTFSTKADTVTKHVAAFRGQAPVLPESHCHPLPSKPLPTEPIRRVDLGPLGSFGHKTGFLGSQECLIRKVPQAIVAPFRRAPPASASSTSAPVIPIHRASIPTTAAVSVSPAPSSVVTQASLESPSGQMSHPSSDDHHEPVQRKENWASSSKEASPVHPPSVRDPGAGDSSVSALVTRDQPPPQAQDKMQSKIRKCQVAVERLRQDTIDKPHAVTVVEPDDAMMAESDLSSDCVTTNLSTSGQSEAVLNIEVTAEKSGSLNIVSGDRSSKENKCSNNKLESAIKKEGNGNDSSKLLTKVSGGNLTEDKITKNLDKTELMEPEQNIIKSRKRRRKTNKTGFPTKVKKKRVLSNNTKPDNETVVTSDANKNISTNSLIDKPAPALHPGCDGSGKFDKRDTFKISAANIETDPSRQSTSGRPLRVCRVQEDTSEEKEETGIKKSSSEGKVKREKRQRSSDDGRERKKIKKISSKHLKQSPFKGTLNSYEPSPASSDVESVDFRSYVDAMEMDVGDFLSTLPSSEDNLLSPSLSESSEQQPGDKKRKAKPDLELKKNFIRAGLFSQDYKTEKSRKQLSDGENNFVKTKGTMYNPTEHPFSLLPPPYYCGRQLRQKKEDFALPFDLWSLHSSDSLPNRDILAGQNYKRIKTNIFYDVKQSGDYETPACHCKPPTEPGKPACGKSCLNRMTFTECDPDSCALGDRCSNMVIQKQKSSVTVQRFMTRDKGWGIKTRTSVSKGTFIMEYLGEVVTDKEFKRRMQTDYKHDSHHYCLHVGEGLVIDGYRMGGECRFVNHSCAPNCEMQKWSVNGVWRMALFSKVPIDINEELTYDYNFSWFDTREGQACHCGAEECRGIIGGKGKKSSTPKSSKSSNSKDELKSKKNSDASELQKEKNHNSKSQFTMEHLNHSSLNQFVPIKSMSTNQKDFCRKHSVLLLRNLDKIKRMRDLFFYGEGNVTGRSYSKTTSKRVSCKGMNIEQHGQAPVDSEQNVIKPEVEENIKDNQSFLSQERSVQTRLIPFNSENSAPSKVTQISNIFQNIIDRLGDLKDEQGGSIVSNFDKEPKKEESPLYKVKITEHIDFSMIKTSLKAGSYYSVTQIDQDILLLFQNNIRFYGLSHQLGKYARDLRIKYKEVSLQHRAPLAEIVGDKDVQCLNGSEEVRKGEEDVINCGCGQFRDEGVMIQCDKCECWQHTDCVLPDLKEDEEPPDNWICDNCDPEKKDRTPVDIALVPQPEFAGPGETYNVFMLREDGMQLKLGMTVYVLRAPKAEDDIKETKKEGEENITVGHGGIPHKSISPIKGPSKEAESLHAGNYPTYKSVDADLVSTQDMDIFRVERLWVNEAGKKFAFGYHYLRPHETFHEPSRKFYDNEVFRVPLYEVLPLDTIWKQCWVMDPVTFCRGRPNEAREEDVYICEHRVDKTARLFNKISKHKHPTCTKFYIFTEFDLKLKLMRSYTPHQLPAKSTIPKGTKKVSSDNQGMEVTTLNKKKLKMKKYYPKIVFKKRTTASVESVSKNLLLSLKDSEPLDLSNLLHGMKNAHAVKV